MAELLSHLHLHAVGLAVEIGLALAEEPVHAVAHARRDIKVLQKGEIRQLDGEVVGHAVLELVQETRLEMCLRDRDRSEDHQVAPGVQHQGGPQSRP